MPLIYRLKQVYLRFLHLTCLLIIEQLNNKGYLIKTKDENDKRSYFVSITELGEEQLRNIYKHYLGPIYELRRKIGDNDFFQLMEYIEEANIKMNEQEEGIY